MIDLIDAQTSLFFETPRRVIAPNYGVGCDFIA
jgi:hypothetical protein